MKNISVLFLLCCFFQVSYSQSKPLSPAQQQEKRIREQRGDSAIADREMRRIKALLPLSPGQEQQLFEAGIEISRRLRAVYNKYGNTDQLPKERAKADSIAAGLYKAIIGEKNYQAYKDTQRSRLVRPENNIRLDSLIRKTQPHEKE